MILYFPASLTPWVTQLTGPWFHDEPLGAIAYPWRPNLLQACRSQLGWCSSYSAGDSHYAFDSLSAPLTRVAAPDSAFCVSNFQLRE